MVNIEAKWVRNGNTLALLKLIQGNQKKGKKKSDGFPNKITGISISNFPYYFNFFFFSINYFSILMQKMPNVESCSVMNRDSN